MDSRRFDSMTRALSATTTRRQALKLLAGVAAGGALSLFGFGRGRDGSGLSVPAVPAARADAPANDHFWKTWARTDKPVADGLVSRTWMWGPEAFTGPLEEDYAESPNGRRQVQYFDKSRMEITTPGVDPSSEWYVTNGLLVVELVTGQMQVGNDAFEPRAPAQVNVAGDADDPTGPTYATFNALRTAPPLPDGATITQRVDRDGVVTNDPSLASHGVTAAQRVTVPGIDHQVASPFWSFMTSSGTVYENSQMVTAPLFSSAYYATGLPITEPYWASVKIANTYRDVLIQCFERRCLTYTPGNPPGWQVEAGNVGQHYHAWRYAAIDTTQASGSQESDILDWLAQHLPATVLHEHLIALGHELAAQVALVDAADGVATQYGLVRDYSALGQPVSARLLYGRAAGGAEIAVALLLDAGGAPVSALITDAASHTTVHQFDIDQLTGLYLQAVQDLSAAPQPSSNARASGALDAPNALQSRFQACVDCRNRCYQRRLNASQAASACDWSMAMFSLAGGFVVSGGLALALPTGGGSLLLGALGATVLWSATSGRCDEFHNADFCDAACNQSSCADEPCGAHEMCSVAQVCCPGVETCRSALQRCPACLTDAHCPDDLICRDTACVPPSEACADDEILCSSPASAHLCCPPGWACAPDGCKPPQGCDDPARPHMCPNGTCVPAPTTSEYGGCCSDADCADPGAVCNHAEGICNRCKPGYVWPSGVSCCDGQRLCPPGWYCTGTGCCHPNFPELCS